MSLCVGADGNIYVSDIGNHAIRKITPQGMVTTIAGNGTSGFADGQGADARFNFPSGITIDKSGNIFVADLLNHTIRKITPLGLVSTIAGISGITGGADGPANVALFYLPSGIIIDSTGNLYIADLGNNRIRKLTPNGIVSTIAGEFSGYLDGPANTSLFARPAAITIDKNGNLYVAEEDNHRIRKISTELMVTTIAGSGPAGTGSGSGSFADGDALTQAEFNTPSGLVVDNAGNIFVADRYNHRIRKISTQGIVTTIAGTGGASFNDGPGSSAMFHQPSDICHDSTGNLFVADLNNHRIRKIEFLEQFVTIEGTVFVDRDSSCGFTPGDTGIGERMIELQHTTGKYYVFTSSIGNYSFTGPPGSYIIRLVNNFVTTESCEKKTYSHNLTVGQSISARNFFITDDCHIDINFFPKFQFPFNSPCPGIPFEYCFEIKNIGTEPIVATNSTFLSFHYSTMLTINNVVTQNCGLTITDIETGAPGRLGIFASGILGINDICEICVEVLPDPAIPVDQPPIEIINSNAEAGGICPDPVSEMGFTNTTDNTGPFSDFVTCSKDPNDKLLISPKGCGIDNKINKNIPLSYQIRFQNTGNAPALRVIIKDTLDPDLDITTVNIAGTSHNLTNFKILPPNVLVWTFDNINLPDSLSDTEGSKGFVRFRIQHLPGLADGTQIVNRAAIFFDFNEPVITNTTINTLFDEVVSVPTFEFERQCAFNAYDFFYTGSDQNVSASWDFGTGSTPRKSTLLNPVGITFDSPGNKEIILSVFNNEECSSFIIDTIEIADLSCAPGKIAVCHMPPGKPDKNKTICIDVSSISDHTLHGDCIGPCMANNASNKKPDTFFEDNSQNFDNNISLYPNPFIDYLQITLPSEYKTINEAAIYNCLGLKVWNAIPFKNADNKIIIKLPDLLPAGIYYCVLQINDTSVVRKLTKL